MDTTLNLQALRNRTVVVTGARGFIGRHVVSIARQEGIRIIAPTSRKDADSGFVYLDILDRDALRAFFAEANPVGVIHLAAVGVVGGSSVAQGLLINAVGTTNILETLVELGMRIPVVIAGSGFEYAAQTRPIQEDDPIGPGTPYGVGKAASTLAASLFGVQLPVTVLRLFSVYGDGERLPRLGPSIIDGARRGERIELSGCEQIRDYVYVGDAAESFWRAMTSFTRNEFNLLNIGSGDPISLRVFVERLAVLLNERGFSVDLSFGAKSYRQGEPMHYVADIERLRSTLHWVPATPLETGLRRMIEAAI